MQETQKEFEKKCAGMPGFNPEKDNAGNYLDPGTQIAWRGWLDAENPPDLDYPWLSGKYSQSNKEPIRERISDWEQFFIDELPPEKE
ncbi:hypothetical protein M1V18_004367 [Salmonella enterica]|nr:hypothetical protein [Salmonella enterica]